MGKLFYSVRELADKCKVDEPTVWNEIEAGTIWAFHADYDDAPVLQPAARMFSTNVESTKIPIKNWDPSTSPSVTGELSVCAVAVRIPAAEVDKLLAEARPDEFIGKERTSVGLLIGWLLQHKHDGYDVTTPSKLADLLSLCSPPPPLKRSALIKYITLARGKLQQREKLDE